MSLDIPLTGQNRAIAGGRPGAPAVARTPCEPVKRCFAEPGRAVYPALSGADTASIACAASGMTAIGNQTLTGPLYVREETGRRRSEC